MPRPNRPLTRRFARPRLEALEGRALLATFTVTDLGDSGPGTLRDAIARANLDRAQDTINVAPGLTGTIALKSALPDLSTSMTIAGPGSSKLAVSRAAPAATDFRIFTVDAGATVGMSDLAVTKGGGFLFGGGIANAGTLLMTRCIVAGNVIDAPLEKGPPGPFGGGGVYNSGLLGITNSLIAQNVAPGVGGVGFPSQFALVTGGGGLFNAGTAVIVGSTIAVNAGGYGGGIANTGTLSLLNATITGNVARAIGSLSGAIDNSIDGVLTVVYSTITANAAQNGGGIVNSGPFPGHQGRMTLLDSIVAGNFRLSGTQVNDIIGFLDPSSTGNLIGVQRDAGGNMIGGLGPQFNPRLGPLTLNGGPTPTVALLPGSPAIGRAIALAGISTDQRGVRRPQGLRPDVGAFEFRSSAPH